MVPFEVGNEITACIDIDPDTYNDFILKKVIKYSVFSI